MFIIPSIKGARHSSVFCGIVWQTVFSLVGSQELLCVKTLRCIPDAWQTCASIFLIDFRFLGWRLNGSLCEKLYPCFTLSWLYSHFSHLFIDSLWYFAIQFHSIISIYVSLSRSLHYTDFWLDRISGINLILKYRIVTTRFGVRRNMPVYSLAFYWHQRILSQRAYLGVILIDYRVAAWGNHIHQYINKQP